MKRICALAAVLWVMFVLFPSIGSAQSEKDGIAVFKEAEQLRTKARSKEDLEKAIEKYQKALEIFKRSNAEKWQGTALNNIGEVYRSLGQYQKGLEYYEKALAITQKVGDVNGEGITLNSIGL